ncbi:upstream activation factor subunit spp27-like [Canna indica]|uniref:Upstream activation factor subunit spp27-like n=1 Tax=Canna indica TaxID=4628 RepID=A0AAQ3JV45_9LILI|nr:upstream activation factor subunit spp27-like [Canna indica]
MSRVLGGCRALMAAARAGAKGAAAPASTATKEAAASPAAAPAKSKRGLLKPVPLSTEMRKFVGVPEMSRTEAIKKIWEHIKDNKLQNPSNKREFFCDEKLKTIFGDKDKVGMLEIARLISPHFHKSN